jgi:hypothetical protein
MMGSKLNAHWQVIIRDLKNMHEKPLPPTGARRRMELEYQDWARESRTVTRAGFRAGKERKTAVMFGRQVLSEVCLRLLQCNWMHGCCAGHARL